MFACLLGGGGGSVEVQLFGGPTEEKEQMMIM
jgi:hypothetical protein